MQPAKVIDVLSPMYSGQCSICYVLEKRQVKAVKMEMENVEVARLLPNLRQHDKVSWHVPGELLVEPKRYISAWYEFRPRLAIAAREQHYVMTAVN